MVESPTERGAGVDPAPLGYWYVCDDAGTPLSLRPEVEVKVDGKTWKRVPSLEHSKPTDRVYILREDTGGHCTVRFGDGITGARVPTGTGCMAATYRVGVGAYGNVRGTRTEKIVTEDDHAAALIESMVRIGDELSRYQDMVAQQAYLGTARTRRRLEKHAQKLGYQLHAGMSMLNLLLTLMDSKTTVTSHRGVTKRST